MTTRLEYLWADHARIEAEILAEQARIAEEYSRANPGRLLRSRREEPPHGTEQGYQRHRTLGDYCDPCRRAHRLHERERTLERTDQQESA